jgi:hypothetical protein
MNNDEATQAPEPSHDDMSNSGSPGEPAIPEFDNQAHDRDDDGPEEPSPRMGERRSPEEKITGKPMSDMAPPGQDEALGPD